MKKIIILGFLNLLNTITEQDHKVKIKELKEDIMNYDYSILYDGFCYYDSLCYNQELLDIEIDEPLLHDYVKNRILSNFMTLFDDILGTMEVTKLFISYNKENIYKDIFNAYIYLNRKIKLLFPEYSYEAILITEHDLIREILKFDCVENDRLDNSCWKGKRINKILLNDNLLSLKYKEQKILDSNDCIYLKIMNDGLYHYTPITINYCNFMDIADRESLIIFKHIINEIYNRVENLKERIKEESKIIKERIIERREKEIREKERREKEIREKEYSICSIQ